MDLISRARAGEREALEELLRQNYGILKGYLLKIGCDYDLTEDLIQETMYRAVKNIKRYKATSKFSTWLITIATNLYRDQLRKGRKEILYADITDDLQYRAEQLDITLEAKEKFLQLQNIMAGLPFEKRAVLVLKHYYGYSYQEMADILQCPVGTIKSRLHYSLDYLKNKLREGGQQLG